MAVPKGFLLSSTALLMVLAFAASADAQGVTELEGVTIYSANRTPTDAAKVGSSVEVITEKELESRSQTFVKDYLETLPGVNFNQNGPPGTAAGISLRGAYGRYVKVLVDGMDVSDPSAPQTATSFEHLLVGDVSRIEVLKGSQSTIYGGDAVGGVISIETKAARKPGLSASGIAEGGAYNSYRGSGTVGYASTNGSNISFTVQGVDTDGFSAASVGTEDDGYQNLTLSGRGEYVLSPSMKVFFSARALDADYAYDGYPPPFYTLNDTADSGTTVQQAGRLGTEFSLFNGAFQNTLAIQGMEVERDTYSSGMRTNWYDGDRIKGEYKGVLTFNDKLSLLAGADWERTGAETSSDPNRHTADLTGAYAQLMMEPIGGLVLTGGGRIDDHSMFGDFNTYRLTGAYLVPGTETKFRASVGTGFRVPSLFELFDPNYGNDALTPEESDSWDAGVEQGFLAGKLKVGATHFELDTDNLIAFAFPGGYYNVPGVTHREGVELTGAARVTSGFTVTAGYTYVDTEQANGERLIRVPRHNFVVGFDLQPIDKVEIGVTAKYVADTLDDSFDARGIVALEDYVLLNAKASYEFTPGWKAYVRGENLLDEEYETVIDYGTAGLSVYGGIQVALPD
jgi:vitamin B12 transporter